ncbi:LexA family transcriptional regulator [Lactococcus piscium]|uniref:XRE family transcriptional regulator n=1 Tax=Pseudolactococcus paracarnosus TaxID=2749962 RepID=UPI001FBB865C|nr:XRE family transcriptional regulator [Lactococcus paracarnosus]MCJ1993771.1 LexA family transcriptional regulator [Lactococcus paracarnosus]
MTTIGKRIKSLRESKNLTQTELSEILGMKTYTTVSKWESDDNFPKGKDLKTLSQLFNVSSDYLLGLSIEKKANIKQNDLISNILETSKKLKVNRQENVLNYAKSELKEQKASNSKVMGISDYQAEKEYSYYDDAVSAGTGQYIGISQKETITLPVDFDADFVVPVYGDSMEPDYHDGDYIFVKLSVDLSDGDIGVFELYGDTYVKQLVIEDDHAYLHSLNKKYKDMLVDADSDFRIIGKVVGRFA